MRERESSSSPRRIGRRGEREFSPSPRRKGRRGEQEFSPSSLRNRRRGEQEFSPSPRRNGRRGEQEFSPSSRRNGRGGEQEFSSGSRRGERRGERDFSPSPRWSEGRGEREFSPSSLRSERRGEQEFSPSSRRSERGGEREFSPGLRRQEQERKLGRSGRTCPLPACRKSTGDLRLHTLQEHFPEGWLDWGPQEVVVALTMLATAVAKCSSLEALWDHMGVGRMLLPETVMQQDIEFCGRLGRHLGEALPSELDLSPPNTLVALAHWAVLLQILYAGGVGVQREFRTLRFRGRPKSPPPLYCQESPSKKPRMESGEQFPPNRHAPVSSRGRQTGAPRQIELRGGTGPCRTLGQKQFRGRGGQPPPYEYRPKGMAKDEWRRLPKLARKRWRHSRNVARRLEEEEQATIPPTQDASSGTVLIPAEEYPSPSSMFENLALGERSPETIMKIMTFPEKIREGQGPTATVTSGEPQGTPGREDVVPPRHSVSSEEPGTQLSREGQGLTPSAAVTSEEPQGAPMMEVDDVSPRRSGSSGKPGVQLATKWEGTVKENGGAERSPERMELALAGEACSSPATEEEKELLGDGPTPGPWRFSPRRPRPEIWEAVDSHFHMDRLAESCRQKREQGRSYTVAVVLENATRGRQINKQKLRLRHLIASFCDLKTHALLDGGSRMLRDLVAETRQDRGRVGLCFGIHPKHAQAYNLRVAEHTARLLKLLSMAGVVGVGEVGLDYSVPGANRERSPQKQALENLLAFQDSRMTSLKTRPWVLHCRESSLTSPPVAGAALRGILQTHFPPSAQFMLHHFTGPIGEITKWLEAFPNTVFSVGGVDNNTSGAIRDAIKAVPDNKLLLETDAPHFGGTTFSTPYAVFDVARVVAVWRGVEQRELLRLTVDNARRFFRLTS
ncbi:uncharacterized protein [Littorina saxatilis]|uniref:uncharacterized protein n=1 Tax=Littorina saxatilis TaxID=31220 RepID=UPI0038B559E2